jgi:hypothetical protein
MHVPDVALLADSRASLCLGIPSPLPGEISERLNPPMDEVRIGSAVEKILFATEQKFPKLPWFLSKTFSFVRALTIYTNY